MSAAHRVRLITQELPDELQFRVEHELGWIALAIWPVGFLACEGFARMLPASNHRLPLAIGGLILLVPLFTIRRHLTWKLSVTGKRFAVSGYYDPFAVVIYIPHNFAIPESRVKWMGYGENDRGFYLDCGVWNKECVLPGLTRQQCDTVIAAIARRLPDLAARLINREEVGL